MILVIGATGNVGSKVVQQLATMGQQVRACVRTAERATTIQGSGVELVKGDLEHPETLDLFRLYSTHFASQVTNVVLEVAKQRPRTFEQFARDHVQAFKR